jgi:hypothetical protein
MFGIVAALYTPENPAVRSQQSRYAVIFAVVMVAVLPWRLEREIATLDLENVRYGVSQWEMGSDGVRYQTFTDRATLFVSRNVKAMRIPLRESRASTRSLVEVRLDGRFVDRVETGPEWRHFRVRTGGTTSQRPFLRLDLVLTSDGALESGREVQVGRLELLDN